MTRGVALQAVLDALDEEPRSVAELAERAGLQRHQAGRLLLDLWREGLAVRGPDDAPGEGWTLNRG